MARPTSVKVKQPEQPEIRPPNRLRFLRERSRLTQAEVAKVLDYDHSTVSRHESGDRDLDADDIRAYAGLYKVESYEIFQSL